jgi:YihY family inner membrane protein
MSRVMARLRALDRFQQRHRRLSFGVAVYKKFSDDSAGSLAALMSYYAFVSLFPLLLVFVTILGFVVHNDPSEQHKILQGTLGQFPVISDQLRLHALSGSALGLIVGVLGSLWAGLGVTAAAQNAFNQIWDVPLRSRPNFLKSRWRSLRLLAALGVLSIISTVAAGFVGTGSHGALTVVAGVVVAFVANLALFGSAFVLLTAADVKLRDLWPGIVLAAVLWQGVEHLGGVYAAKAAHDSAVYGTFAIVLGLLAYLYLGSQMTLLAAEVNVVRKHHLWPRSLFAPPFTGADRRAMEAQAEVQERVAEEDVQVHWREDGARRDSAGGLHGSEPAVAPAESGGASTGA